MYPPLLRFGPEVIHADFHLYRDRFDQEYKTEKILDMRGVEIIFGDSKHNGDNDCAHVCYGGGKAMVNQNPTDWYPERAERILWIKDVLQSQTCTTIHVSNEAKYPNDDARVYLAYLSDDSDPQAGYEYYQVVTVVQDGKTYFKTAYTLKLHEWRAKKQTCPQVWPIKQSKKQPRPKKK